ncbi:polysaccharide deacetylase family protein [Streptomyces sp. NPDC086023]|uniref:polysaccharide deacetylase family protein n=1 Tax=Streptomyces sp. NPDC086023 TaxID=3365746 RepID=UPI0037D71A78
MRTRSRTHYTAKAVVVTAAVAVGALACGAGVGWAAPAPGPGPHGAGAAAVAPKDAGRQDAPQDHAAPGRVPDSFTTASEGGPHTVDITIDDGPNPVWTPQVLAVLAQNHVHATFCLIGKNADKYPSLVERIAAAGNRLCDHSMNHDTTMDKKPADYQKEEILKGQAAVDRAAGGARALYYRAPGGAFTPASRQIAAAHGLRPLGWDVDPQDWGRPGAAGIITAVEDHLGDGPIVLLHDGGGDRSQTVAALRHLLPWLRQHGYGFSFPAQSA